MTSVLGFLEKNYLLFDIIVFFLILSLIVYISTRKKEKENVFKIDNNENNIGDLSSLQNKDDTNVTLQNMVTKNKNKTNGEIKNI